MVTASPAPGSSIPAVHGGRPAFPEGLPFARPTVPDTADVLADMQEILESRLLTDGSFVRKLEDRAAEYLGVKNCVAVASCTSGLMLLLRAAGLSGDVIVPSFTFAATAHAVSWNGLRPTFADIDASTHTLSPAAVDRRIGVRTSAILATHTYGTPCDVDGLAKVAESNGVRLFFDAAHAFGSIRGGAPVGGFGDAEVFSLSPTKIVVAGEGGIIATDDDTIAQRCRVGRNYGNPGDYDCRFVGLNARMSEIHAAIALRSLERVDERITRRNRIAALYRDALGGIPGLGFPGVNPGDTSTYKDFTILVDPTPFGSDAPSLAAALAAEGIQTRRYYVPPVHSMRAYRHLAGTNGALSVTEFAASRVLTLPMWTDMTDEQVGRVADAVGRLRRFPPTRAAVAGVGLGSE